MPHTFIPTAISSNLWIIPSNSETLESTITIICPDKATSAVPLQQPFHILRLSSACSATSRYFHLPLLQGSHYDDECISGYCKYSLNILTSVFRICQHSNSNCTTLLLQKMTNVPEVPVTWLYKHMINTSEPVHSFTFNKDDDKDPSLIWAILMHSGTYIGTISMIFAVCIGVYCFKRFWFRPATPMHLPYSPASS